MYNSISKNNKVNQPNIAEDITINNNLVTPARLNSPQVAEILGYTEKDLNVLIKANHLKPLAKNPDDLKAHKWKFSTVSILALTKDIKWLEYAERLLHRYYEKLCPKKTEKEGAII
jgi:hypothetical protein